MVLQWLFSDFLLPSIREDWRVKQYLLSTPCGTGDILGARHGGAALSKTDEAPTLIELFFLWEIDLINRLQINEKNFFR